jgi:hypothetical protein
MANETNALARPSEPGAPSQDAYQAFYTALSASTQGRAFLTEYARRNRNADTELLLAALDRLEVQIAAQRALPPAPPVELSAPAMPQLPPPEAARVHLAVVEPPDEPELPIPSPASTQQPAIALIYAPEKREPVIGQYPAPTNTLRTAAIMPDIDFAGSAPSRPAVIESAAAAPLPPPAAVALDAVAMPAAVENIEPPATPAAPAADPMAALMAIMALSEDERIALFT